MFVRHDLWATVRKNISFGIYTENCYDLKAAILKQAEHMPHYLSIKANLRSYTLDRHNNLLNYVSQHVILMFYNLLRKDAITCCTKQHFHQNKNQHLLQAYLNK